MGGHGPRSTRPVRDRWRGDVVGGVRCRPSALPRGSSRLAARRVGVARVVVVGSLNVDHTVRVERFPAAGETVTAAGYTFGLGGKGFNQAVTAARMGVDVVMVGCVGADTDGDLLLQALHDERIDGSYVR